MATDAREITKKDETKYNKGKDKIAKSNNDDAKIKSNINMNTRNEENTDQGKNVIMGSEIQICNDDECEISDTVALAPQEGREQLHDVSETSRYNLRKQARKNYCESSSEEEQPSTFAYGN